MQIGPRIRIGGTVGKIGNAIKHVVPSSNFLVAAGAGSLGAGVLGSLAGGGVRQARSDLLRAAIDATAVEGGLAIAGAASSGALTAAAHSATGAVESAASGHGVLGFLSKHALPAVSLTPTGQHGSSEALDLTATAAQATHVPAAAPTGILATWMAPGGKVLVVAIALVAVLIAVLVFARRR